MEWHDWKKGDKPNWMWGGNECVVLVRCQDEVEGEIYEYDDHVFDYWADGHWVKHEDLYGNHDENIIAWFELEKYPNIVIEDYPPKLK